MVLNRIIATNRFNVSPSSKAYLINDGKLAKEVNANYKRLLPLINEYFFTVHPDDLDNVTEQVKQFYFGNRGIGPETDLAFVRVRTDEGLNSSLEVFR